VSTHQGIPALCGRVKRKGAGTPNFVIPAKAGISKWKCAWKIESIEQANPDWDDLFGMINA
jgi:hypothetical protein